MIDLRNEHIPWVTALTYLYEVYRRVFRHLYTTWATGRARPQGEAALPEAQSGGERFWRAFLRPGWIRTAASTSRVLNAATAILLIPALLAVGSGQVAEAARSAETRLTLASLRLSPDRSTAEAMEAQAQKKAAEVASATPASVPSTSVKSGATNPAARVRWTTQRIALLYESRVHPRLFAGTGDNPALLRETLGIPEPDPRTKGKPGTGRTGGDSDLPPLSRSGQTLELLLLEAAQRNPAQLDRWEAALSRAGVEVGPRQLTTELVSASLDFVFGGTTGDSVRATVGRTTGGDAYADYLRVVGQLDARAQQKFVAELERTGDPLTALDATLAHADNRTGPFHVFVERLRQPTLKKAGLPFDPLDFLVTRQRGNRNAPSGGGKTGGRGRPADGNDTNRLPGGRSEDTTFRGTSDTPTVRSGGRRR